MKRLPGFGWVFRPPVASHQGGWDEILIFFGIPMALFVVLRWVAYRRERREEAEGNGDES
jgi:hypothetical protein